MKTPITLFVCLISLMLLMSCASLKKEGESDSSKATNIDPQDIILFEKAFHDLGRKKYHSVIPVFQKLANKYHKQDLEWAALYNLASAYKEIKQCEKAEKIYRKLLPKTKKHIHLKSRIYLSLSYVYECLGQMEQSLIALKEGLPYIRHLESDLRLIEYPARLALAYMRMSEDQTGMQLQKEVYRNLENTKKSFRVSSAADENFARYFYTIGKSHVKPEFVQLDTFLKIFPYHQTYLTQSLLLQDGKWSIKAEKELGDLYRKMWRGLKKQNNKKKYTASVKKALKQLKDISEKSKNKKMKNIYFGLRKKTKSYL